MRLMIMKLVLYKTGKFSRLCHLVKTNREELMPHGIFFCKYTYIKQI